jgi:hypothetical protein
MELSEKEQVLEMLVARKRQDTRILTSIPKQGKLRCM